MRIDIVSIFPDYLAPLDLSLIGNARRSGLLDVRVHDLRQWTHDRHRSVDDTPYGGGAGMVMSPEPWGEALDSLADLEATPPRPHLIVPSPGGQVFTQAVASSLAREPWLAFACGRYEGIDERVIDEARDVMAVSVLSLGDYVLGGGEVAALAMVEAITRLVPGVIGNKDSLTEESHTGGLLEYPVYTKPTRWRGRDVPAVLRSGNHQEIQRWRDQQRRQRTTDRRPDLMPATDAIVGLTGALAHRQDLSIDSAASSDAGELLTLARACWLSEARREGSFDIPALMEDLDDVVTWMADWHTWTVRLDGRIIGSVRTRRAGRNWDIGRLMVAPDLQGCGLGRALIEHAEQVAPLELTGFTVFAGATSQRNERIYRQAGYQVSGRSTLHGVETVELYKPRGGREAE
ncbi:MAG: tRNA (guanosine(37)-N1)-methyltransferase TrmD [Ornithinimicrobium sp.]